MLRSNRAVGIGITVLPEEKVANGEAAIHRVKQITYLGHRPNKGTLNVRQPDFSHRYIFNQFLKDIINLLEKYFCHTYPSTPANIFALNTPSSACAPGMSESPLT